ncbi:MAG: hypothetical protein JJ953_01530 [Gracilimonas sp.]|uniref:hypothetical protein n=1 Tax=Gracilimonas sp. TaxID=1974203 RepID=UPI001B077609|nr:hypothetical protein [Gracilimonas sp.]MBO6584764.1 hypothetical protein [Gracilimonas sp.]MBO6615965.1 hypothetical protein [Gracilimonas sp.]
MPNQILLDNWTLQEISHLGQSGLSSEQTDKLVVDQKHDSHSFEKISSGLIQLQALFSFLQNLILRETIITDSKFINVWDESSSLKRIQSDGLIKVHDFQEEKLKEVRKAIVYQLCVTSSIREIQLQNEQEWVKNKRNVDQFMSQLIWGGAGMLARGHVYETFYLPHPLRGHAFKQSPIAKRDAYTETLSFISTNQTKLLYFDNEGLESIQAKFSLPPLISIIIEESNSFEDLFTVALQLRKEYEDLRSWLKKFQEAIDHDDTKEISKHTKTLKSIQKYIEAKYSPDKFGSLDLSFDILSLSPSLSIPLSVNKIRNKIGVRSTINDLILTSAGYSSIKKLLKLLGEENSTLGKTVYDDLVRSFQNDDNR